MSATRSVRAGRAALPRLEIALLVLVLALGSFLRLRDLDAYRASADEGNYLFSARIQRLERDTDLAARLTEDAEWAWPKYYPHSFAHQLAARWAWRFGAGAVSSIRLDSAILGVLTALVAFSFVARVLRPDGARAGGRRGTEGAGALLAASVVALGCLHVWYARTGWGQSGCTFFYALYALQGYALFARERTLGGDALLAAGMAATSLAAYGWHEMIVVHVGGMGIFVLVHHVLGGAGFEGCGLAALPRTLARSRKAWLALLSALPIVALFSALFFDPFARAHWIDFERTEGGGFVLNLERILRFLFPLVHVERQITYPVLALALAGLVSLFRRDRFAFRYLVTALVASCATFLLFYKDAGLVRIYLPTACVLAVLAGVGLASVFPTALGRARRAGALAAALLLAAWMAATSWQTLFGVEGDPFFARVFHAPDGYDLVDAKDSHRASFELLHARLRPGEWVGVHAKPVDAGAIAGEFSVLFQLMDEGIPAKPFTYQLPPREWPRFVMGLATEMESGRRTLGSGGPYGRIALDAFERFGLYEKVGAGGGG